MTETENIPVKILFRFHSDLLDQEIVETLWAETVNAVLGHYKLNSLPFYVPLIAVDDTVYAQYDDGEEMLKYIETVEPSGNSNLWVVVTDDDADIGAIRDVFTELDCSSEALSDRFFAMEVKSTTNYLKIKDKLNELRSEGIIDYSESCLSEQHQY
jgi:hypothetical protein